MYQCLINHCSGWLKDILEFFRNKRLRGDKRKWRQYESNTRRLQGSPWKLECVMHHGGWGGVGACVHVMYMCVFSCKGLWMSVCLREERDPLFWRHALYMETCTHCFSFCFFCNWRWQFLKPFIALLAIMQNHHGQKIKKEIWCPTRFCFRSTIVLTFYPVPWTCNLLKMHNLSGVQLYKKR